MAFGYTARGGARTDREVEPHWLVLLGRCWSPGRLGPGPARLADVPDRPDGAARRSGRHFAPRRLPAPDAGAFVRDSIQALLAPSATGANRSDQAARLTRAAVVPPPLPAAAGQQQDSQARATGRRGRHGLPADGPFPPG